MPSRFEKMTGTLDLRGQVGLEVGPLCFPVVRREHGTIYYADVDTTEGLRTRYATDPAIDVNAIVEVDFATGDKTLRQTIGEAGRFDYVVLSHVFEHLPSPLTYLEDLHALLRPGGQVCMAIPDRRFTFDRCRRETDLGELIEAYLEGRSRPGYREVFDHFHKFVPPSGEEPADPEADRRQRLRAAQDWARTAVARERYVDVHATVYTPSSFLCLMRDAATVGYLRFELAAFWPTAPGEHEFFVTLRRLEQDATAAEIEESYGRFLLPGLRSKGENDVAMEEARIVAAKDGRFEGRVYFSCGTRRYWITEVQWALTAGFRWPEDIEWLDEEEIARVPFSTAPPPDPGRIEAARRLLGLLTS